MDSSQDVFLDQSMEMDTYNSSYGGFTTEVDNKSYDSLYISTKKCLAKNREITAVSTEFYTDFKLIMDNCHDCVKMGLETINIILNEPSMNLQNLIEHIDNIVFIVQQLSDFLTNTVEVTAMNCRQMKTFPIAPGNILVMIFSHCKERSESEYSKRRAAAAVESVFGTSSSEDEDPRPAKKQKKSKEVPTSGVGVSPDKKKKSRGSSKLSESLYDGHLAKLEKQLKDLFRASHSLQLIYLMIMEKNFVFDLSERADYDVLIDALKINLIIGEIVQSLDVKTMAEQWKGYTNICEKYANHLVDSSIFIETSKSLAKMAVNNINIALEPNQDQKITVRSLKVTTFVMKILLKMCHTFKHEGSRDETHFTELIVHIYMHDPSRLTLEGYQPQIVQMIQPTLLTPAEGLVLELVTDDNFARSVLNYDYKKHKKDDKLLGYVLTLISIIKVVLSCNGYSPLWVNIKNNIVTRILEIIPYCHPYLNLPLKYLLPHRTTEIQTYSLYEHLLTNTVCLLSTYNTEQYCEIERLVYEGIMKNDCCCAVFSADLLVLMAKLNPNKQHIYNQLTYFSNAYKELEYEPLFQHSPQKSHLSYTIQILYNSLEQNYKQTFCRDFNILDEDNTGVWIVLKVKGLSRDMKMIAEETVLNRMIGKLNKFLSCNGEFSARDLDYLINSIKLASTCSTIKGDDIENLITQAWLKLCPKNSQLSLYNSAFSTQSVWQLEYYTALVQITETMLMQFQRDTSNLVKILHVISAVVTSENIDLKLISMNLILKLSLYSSHCSNQLENIFKAMIYENNTTFKNKFYENLRKYLSGKKIVSIVTNIVNEDQNLLENWNHYLKNEKLKKNEEIPLKQQLISTTILEYKHKCLNSNCEVNFVKQFDSKSSSGNFEMYEINSFLTPEIDEPVSKRPKLDNSEISTILDRIDKDVQEIVRMKENICEEERCRISAVIGQLKSVVEY